MQAKSIKQFNNYFRTLATENHHVLHNPEAENNDEIVGQCHFSILDADEVLLESTRRGMSTGINIYLSPYEFKGYDNQAGDLRGIYTAGFIVAKLAARGIVQEIEQCYTDTEVVVQEFINRMLADSEEQFGTPRCACPFQNLNLSDFTYTFVQGIWENHYGWFVSFTYQQFLEQEMEADKATDTSVWIPSPFTKVVNNLFIGDSVLDSLAKWQNILPINAQPTNYLKLNGEQSVYVQREFSIDADTFQSSPITSFRDVDGHITMLMENNFRNHPHLDNIYLPGCLESRTGCFNTLAVIKELHLQNIERIKDQSLSQLSAIQRIIVPKLTTLGGSSVRNCSSLIQFYAPLLRNMDAYCFQSLNAITSISLPSATQIMQQCFRDLSLVESIDLSSLNNINNTDVDEGCFVNCPKLKLIKVKQALATNGNILRLQAAGVVVIFT